MDPQILQKAITSAREALQHAAMHEQKGLPASASTILSIEMVKISAALKHFTGMPSRNSRILEDVLEKCRARESHCRASARRQMQTYGLLYKQGHFVKDWHTRFFILSGGQLKYYVPGDTEAKGTIMLQSIRTVQAVTVRQNGFKIETQGKTYYCQAPDEMSLQAWMAALRPLKVGFLMKQGQEVQSWKKRWCMLWRTQLAYFENHTDTNDRKGYILLRDTIPDRVFAVDRTVFGHDNIFQVETRERTFFMQAVSGEDMDEWLQHINDAVASRGPAEDAAQPGNVQDDMAFGDDARPAIRQFNFLVSSPLFHDKRRADVSASSLAELQSALAGQLGMTEAFAITIFDDDFEEWCVCDSIDELPAKAKIKLLPESVPPEPEPERAESLEELAAAFEASEQELAALPLEHTERQEKLVLDHEAEVLLLKARHDEQMALLLVEQQQQLEEVRERQKGLRRKQELAHRKQDAARMVHRFQEERFADEATARRCLDAAEWDLQRAMESYMPPVPESPVSGRTLATSNFKVAYDTTSVPEGPMEIGVILNQLIQTYSLKEGVPWKAEGQPFFKRLQKEAMQNAAELVKEIPESAQRIWTSALQLRGHEFCYILNAAVRSDDEDLCEAMAGLCRAINKLCVTAGVTGHAALHPPGDVCYRGAGFEPRYRSFFVTGRQFRQPAYLATSFSRSIAEGFMARSQMATKILWLVHIHPERKCVHVNLVKRSNVPGEEEYLFAPYSAFTVVAAAWNSGTDADPHVVELMAAVDNKGEPEDLPLAPWS